MRRRFWSFWDGEPAAASRSRRPGSPGARRPGRSSRKALESLEARVLLTLSSAGPPVAGPSEAPPGFAGQDLGTTVSGDAIGTLSAGGSVLYRIEAAVSGSLAVTFSASDNVQGHIALQALDGDASGAVLAGGPAAGFAAGESQTVRLPVTQGQAVVLRVSGVEADARGIFFFGFDNLDQFDSADGRTRFFPTAGAPASIAVADLNGDSRPDVLVTSADGSDPISVLLGDGNGDGAFGSPRPFDVGPGLGDAPGTLTREPGLADFNGDGITDVAVPNARSADVSVLLGNGDGSFQPQRRFDALPGADSLATGDFDGDGTADIVVLQHGPGARFAMLPGRGDGTFGPAITSSTAFLPGAFPVRAGDFDGDGTLDLVVLGADDPLGQLFLGNGDGTFRDAGTFATGVKADDARVVGLDGDGRPDLVIAGSDPGTGAGAVAVLFGQGGGTFRAPRTSTVLAPGPGETVRLSGLTVTDFGAPPLPGAPADSPELADGFLDIVVSAESAGTGANAGAAVGGAARLILLPGLANADGRVVGFGAPQVLATLGKAGKIAAADFDHDGETDLAVTDVGGVRLIFGKPTASLLNDSPGSARDLGSATHLATLPQAIDPGHADAYYTLTVPSDPASGSGDQVLDFSTMLRNVGGAGLGFEVRDASGALVGSGDRFRVQAAQGAVLTLHVFGRLGLDGSRGSGTYTMEIDVLPQLVSVQALAALPGGPATCIVLTLQGDRLDRPAAEDPSNYTVTWFGPDGLPGTGDDRVIPIGVIGGGRSVVYNPGANVAISNGLTYLTSTRQTVTLLFAGPLPPGSYAITLSPDIQVASPQGDGEASGPAGDGAFAGRHPVVSLRDGTIVDGIRFVGPDLVPASTTPVDPHALEQGTPFVSQLQGDLTSLLDDLLARDGDSPTITDELNKLILAWFAPWFAGRSPSEKPATFTVLWFDPVSIDLQTPQGQGVSYNLASNQLSNTLGQAYVSVGGNVELIVLANASGTFHLDVSNATGSARGGAVVFNGNGGESQVFSFTDALRGGSSSFEVSTSPTTGGGGGGGEGGGGGVPIGPGPFTGGPVVVTTPTPSPTGPPVVTVPGPAGPAVVTVPDTPSGPAPVFTQQAALTLVAALTTGVAMVPTSASGSSTQGIASGGPGVPGVAIVAGGAPVNTSNNTPTTARGQGASNGEEQQPPAVDDTLRKGVRAAVAQVKGAVSRLMVLLKTLRGKSGSPFLEFWRGLIRDLIRALAPTANPGIQALALPPIPRGEAGAVALPATATATGDLWDRGLDGLLADLDRDGDGDAAGAGAGGDAPAIADAYWSALLLSAVADEVRLRAASGRPTRRKARARPGMTK